MDFDLSTLTFSTGSEEIGKFLTAKEEPRKRRKIASLGDLDNFLRVSSDTLVHKIQQDLWALKKEADGQFYIERLFDDSGEPVKG